MFDPQPQVNRLDLLKQHNGFSGETTLGHLSFQIKKEGALHLTLEDLYKGNKRVSHFTFGSDENLTSLDYKYSPGVKSDRGVPQVPERPEYELQDLIDAIIASDKRT